MAAWIGKKNGDSYPNYSPQSHGSTKYHPSAICSLSNELKWSLLVVVVFFPLDWLAIATQQLTESIVCMYFIFIFGFSGAFLCFQFLYRSFPLIILPFCRHFGSFGLLFGPILSLYIASIEHQIHHHLLFFSPI